MSTLKPTPDAQAEVPDLDENSTDATRGQPLASRARQRKAELEALLKVLPDDEPRAHTDIELALAEVNQWLAGDVEHLSHVTGADLSRWLERTKHLAEATPTS